MLLNTMKSSNQVSWVMEDFSVVGLGEQLIEPHNFGNGLSSLPKASIPSDKK